MARVLVSKTSITGEVKIFAGPSAPDGYFLCNGDAVSRTTYSELFAAIGITHGQGDGLTTFNLPDYRGRFLRGLDGAAGRDPDKLSRTSMATGGNTGNTIGSVQGEGTKNPGFTASTGAAGAHQHRHNALFDAAPGGGGGRLQNSTSGMGPTNGIEGVGDHTHSVTISGGNNETRPLNANVNYIIKY